MNRNIELKAFYPNLAHGHVIAREIGASLHGVERQRDSYFQVDRGRLKLRERIPLAAPPVAGEVGETTDSEIEAQLIWYERPDAASARKSDYELVSFPSTQGPRLRPLLAGALGLTVEVVKERTIYLFDDVRIHLDDVERLGRFIEFEAIVGPGCNELQGHRKVTRLTEVFGIAPDQIQERSYADLMRDVA